MRILRFALFGIGCLMIGFHTGHSVGQRGADRWWHERSVTIGRPQFVGDYYDGAKSILCDWWVPSGRFVGQWIESGSTCHADPKERKP